MKTNLRNTLTGSGLALLLAGLTGCGSMGDSSPGRGLGLIDTAPGGAKHDLKRD